MNHTGLDIWVIYKHPLDWPDWYVARRWVNDVSTDDTKMARDIHSLRDMLPPGLTRLSPSEGDDEVIVEVWL